MAVRGKLTAVAAVALVMVVGGWWLNIASMHAAPGEHLPAADADLALRLQQQQQQQQAEVRPCATGHRGS